MLRSSGNPACSLPRSWADARDEIVVNLLVLAEMRIARSRHVAFFVGEMLDGVFLERAHDVLHLR